MSDYLQLFTLITIIFTSAVMLTSIWSMICSFGASHAIIFRSHLLWEMLFNPGGKPVKLGWLNTLCSASWRGTLINSAWTLDRAGWWCWVILLLEKDCVQRPSALQPPTGIMKRVGGLSATCWWEVGYRLMASKKKILTPAVRGPFFLMTKPSFSDREKKWRSGN